MRGEWDVRDLEYEHWVSCVDALSPADTFLAACDLLMEATELVVSSVGFISLMSSHPGTLEHAFGVLAVMLPAAMYAIGELYAFFECLFDRRSNERVACSYKRSYIFLMVAMVSLVLLLSLTILENWHLASHPAFMFLMGSLMLFYLPGLDARIAWLQYVLQGRDGAATLYPGYRNHLLNLSRSSMEEAGDMSLEDLSGRQFSSSLGGRSSSHNDCGPSLGSFDGGAKRSLALYEGLWDSVIVRKINDLCREAGVFSADRKRAKSKIYYAYCELNAHCSENYLSSPGRVLDRHKVAACYTYAVLAARPMEFDASDCSSSWGMFANERLALTVGLSIVASFTHEYLFDWAAAERDPDFAAQLREEASRFAAEGMLIPREVGHDGTYLVSLCRCLQFTGVESLYNILMLALLYFNLERDSMDGSVFSSMLARYADEEGVVSRGGL